MTGTFSATVKSQAKVLIQRTGSVVDVMRDDGSASVNTRGKISDTDVTMAKQGEETVVRTYPNESDEPSLRGSTGGRRQTDAPNIHLQHDTIVQEGDRLDFPDGNSYAIERKIDRKSHYETETALVKS